MNTFYISKTAPINGDGTSWAQAWPDLDKIDWAAVWPGDVIYIDGGAERMEYAAQLKIEKSGAEGRPIVFKLSSEPGRDGKAVFFGGRRTPLPEGDAHPHDWILPNEFDDRNDVDNGRGIDFNGQSHIVVDGVKWKGIEISGCNSDGVYMRGGHLTVKCLHIYDCGTWGQSQEPEYDGAPQGFGIMIGGPHLKIKFCVIHDNGEDCIQALSHTDCSHVLVDHSWLYNSRLHSTKTDASFNWAMHNDSIQYWWGNRTFNDLVISNCIIGPAATTMIGEEDCAVSGVMHVNSLFVGEFAPARGYQMCQGAADASENWTWERCTLAGPPMQKWTSIEYTGKNPVVKDSIITGWRHIGLKEAPVASGSFFYGMEHYTTGPDHCCDLAAHNTVADPEYKKTAYVRIGEDGWDDFDYTPTNPVVAASGAGSSIRSVKDLFAVSPSD